MKLAKLICDYKNIKELNLFLENYYHKNKNVKLGIEEFHKLILYINNKYKYDRINNYILKNETTKESLQKVLGLFSDNKLNYLLQKLNNKNSITEFFKYKIENENYIIIDKLELDKDLVDFILNFRFNRVIIDNLELNVELKDIAFYLKKLDFIEIKHNKKPNFTSSYKKLILPSIKYNSWKNVDKNKFRLYKDFTIKTNLYLELGKVCNAKCCFCRNEALNRHDHNISVQFNKLINIYPYIDNLFIGGGEPTLKSNKLKEFKEMIVYNNLFMFDNKNIFVYTNGTSDLIIKELEDNYSLFKFYLSRHSIYDEENSKIFGINKENILNNDILNNLKNKNHVTMSCTCIKDGLDSLDKIIKYIDYYNNMGFNNFLISDLHKEDYTDLCNQKWNNFDIDENIFKELKSKLINEGFLLSYPIYSTGSYVAYMLKKDNINITIKNYITKQELDDNFSSCVKRTFDLSMDPSGNIYENWNQKSNKIDLKILKKEY